VTRALPTTELIKIILSFLFSFLLFVVKCSCFINFIVAGTKKNKRRCACRGEEAVLMFVLAFALDYFSKKT
jgi:hypothetical protein